VVLKKISWPMHNKKIGIIGTGFVGAAIAYTLVIRNVVPRLLLYDLDQQRCHAELLDLQDATLFSSVNEIRCVDAITDLSQSDIIIIAAGKKQRIGQTRDDLLQNNKKVITVIAANLQTINTKCVVIVVTNPVDLLTCQLHALLPLPKSQIIGSGTLLDSNRLRYALAQCIGFHPSIIDALVIGQHGDEQVALFSSIKVDGKKLTLDSNVKKKIKKEVVQKAYKIIEGNGATYFGVASCVAQMCEIILYDKKEILPVVSYQKEFDCCFSMPAVLGAHGVQSYVDVELSDDELEQLKKFIQLLKNNS
jgi:L-lactate dehydrogenase